MDIDVEYNSMRAEVFSHAQTIVQIISSKFKYKFD